MDKSINAGSYIPAIWSQELVDPLKQDSFVYAQFNDLGRECMWHEGWITVVMPGSERFRPEEVKIELVDSFGLRVTGSKVIVCSVPDVDAQDDLQTLLDKWTAEGKDDMVYEVMSGTDGCGCCSNGESVMTRLCRDVKKTVERTALVEDCTFYMARSRGTISIPRINSLVTVTVESDGSA